MRVVIIEDNAKLAEYMRVGLSRHGISSDWVSSAAEADAALATASYDSIVLDLGLPDIDGTDWLNALRRRGDNRPVLVLTARDAAEEVVRNLDIGADDYMRKPFEMTELVARLRALARRPGTLSAPELRAGNVVLDLNSGELRVAGGRIDLGRREAHGLEVLLRRAGRVVTKAALEGAVYGNDDEVSANAIEVLVHRLRKRLAEAGATIMIHTLRGIGYVLSEDTK
jgi:DNA-binding response OmpR family regulator